MSTETTPLYRIEVTEFQSGVEDDNGIQRLLISGNEDPVKPIMRLLSADKPAPRAPRAPRADKGVPRKAAGTEGK